ncbi:hypothetical protein GCM10022403_057940 [Streptomyces coacervatus]|uniref:Uncharacterized protein n=1 Tax=Streptomyces coacervatus TaxID=647381 RepID=A0ABP7IEY1_9ACTN
MAPNSAMTVPATAYDPEARITASIADSGTIPYDSLPSRAAAKVRRACGIRSTAAYDGRRATDVEDTAVPQLEAWKGDA